MSCAFLLIADGLYSIKSENRLTNGVIAFALEVHTIKHVILDNLK